VFGQVLSQIVVGVLPMTGVMLLKLTLFSTWQRILLAFLAQAGNVETSYVPSEK
jgi:hypothetical protein